MSGGGDLTRRMREAFGRAFAGVNMKDEKAVLAAADRFAADNPELVQEINVANEADMAKLRELDIGFEEDLNILRSVLDPDKPA